MKEKVTIMVLALVIAVAFFSFASGVQFENQTLQATVKTSNK